MEEKKIMIVEKPEERLNWNARGSNVMKPNKTILENGGIDGSILPTEWHSWTWNLVSKWQNFFDYLTNANEIAIENLNNDFSAHNHDNLYAKSDGSTDFNSVIISGKVVQLDENGNIAVDGTSYLSIDSQVSNPSLKITKQTRTKYGATRQGFTKYGFLTTEKPVTPTLKIKKNGVDYYLNQPRIPFTITKNVSLTCSASQTKHDSPLTQGKVYSASWSFSGTVRVNDSWRESSKNHGDALHNGSVFRNIGHDWQNLGGHTVEVRGSGILKNDSEELQDVSSKISLLGVGSSSWGSPSTTISGTLTVTGYKLP